MKSLLSRFAIATIVPALLIAAAPVTAKPVPKAPTIAKVPALIKAQDAVTQANPKNKAPKKNAKIEAFHAAITNYYADLNRRMQPTDLENFGSGGFSFFEVATLQLQSVNGNKAEVLALVLDRSYGGSGVGPRGSRQVRYYVGGIPMIKRDVILKLEKKGSIWTVESTNEISSQMVGGRKIIH
jgi:hypothetical protein